MTRLAQRLRPSTLGRIFAAFAVAIALLVVAVPANAASSDGVCESKEVCIYEHTSWGGEHSDYQWWHEDYSWHTWDSCVEDNIMCFQNDETSSLKNRDGTWKVRLFTSDFYDGSSQILDQYEYDSHANYNDLYSSHCWNDGTIAGDRDGYDPSCHNF